MPRSCPGGGRGGRAQLELTDALLQKLASLIFAEISRYRSETVASALQLRQTCVGETPNKPSLAPVEQSIVAYIAGYVGRKTWDRSIAALSRS